MTDYSTELLEYAEKSQPNRIAGVLREIDESPDLLTGASDTEKIELLYAKELCKEQGYPGLEEYADDIAGKKFLRDLETWNPMDNKMTMKIGGAITAGAYVTLSNTDPSKVPDGKRYEFWKLAEGFNSAPLFIASLFTGATGLTVLNNFYKAKKGDKPEEYLKNINSDRLPDSHNKLAESLKNDFDVEVDPDSIYKRLWDRVTS